MLDIKKTVRNATFILIICILVIAFFEVAPIIERQYSSRYFIVNFYSDEKKVHEVFVNENNPVIKPEDPIREGYTFMGWFYKDEQWSFAEHIVTENMTLIEQWQINQYTITFDTDGGSIIEPITKDYNL